MTLTTNYLKLIYTHFFQAKQKILRKLFENYQNATTLKRGFFTIVKATCDIYAKNDTIRAQK